jgi:hypothetical protein
MSVSKQGLRMPITAIGLPLIVALVAVAQQPTRQPTRRVEGQAQQPQQAGAPGNRQQLRSIPGRTERTTPVIDLSTGTFQLRREIFLRPPRRSPRRVPAQWRLGLWTDNAPKGLHIREVSRYSPAWRYGIEEGDYLLDIMGYPVGFYEGAYYPLADTLNQVAPRDGWINVLIWNRRTNAEETMWMQAERRRDFEGGESSD